MARRPRSTRLDPWLDQWLADLCVRRGGIEVSEGLRQLVLERWGVEVYRALEYREHLEGLRLGVREGPDVWEVARLWKALDEDGAGLHAHFAGLVDPAGLDEAVEVSRQAPRLVEPEQARNTDVAGTLVQLAGEPIPVAALLLDWCVPAEAFERLRKAGLDVQHVGGLAEPPPRTPAALLARAREGARTLVTAKYLGVGRLLRPMLGGRSEDPPVLFIGPDRDPADAKALASDLEAWVGRKPGKKSGGWAFGWLP